MVLADHLARHGRMPETSGDALIRVLRDAGLTGRDSDGYPVHAALAAAASAVRAGVWTCAEGAGAGGREPTVLARAEPAEPASRKDTALLWLSPHLVLDGLQLAARAVGAPQVRLSAGSPGAAGSPGPAGFPGPAGSPGPASSAGTAGPQPGERLRAQLRREAAERVRAGVDPRPAEIIAPGQPEGQPVLIANVETLAHVALIARYGAAAFRSAGTPAEPGTMLCTIRHPDGRADVAEVPIGSPVGDLVTLDAGTQAVLAGGYHGRWLPTGQAASLPLSNAGLRQAELRLPGASVGAGVIAALPGDRCGLAETSRIARYLAAECQFSAARFVHWALAVFGEEVRLHGQGGCRAPRSGSFLPVPPGLPVSPDGPAPPDLPVPPGPPAAGSRGRDT